MRNIKKAYRKLEGPSRKGRNGFKSSSRDQRILRQIELYERLLVGGVNEFSHSVKSRPKNLS